MAKKMVDECDSDDDLDELSMVTTHAEIIMIIYNFCLSANHDKVSGEAVDRCVHSK